MMTLSRRAFLPAAAALAGASVMPAAAQVVDPRPPTVDSSNPEEIAPGVRVVRDRRVWLVPSIGIILGADAALVVDTGLGPANGERVFDLARRLAGSRRLFLTVGADGVVTWRHDMKLPGPPASLRVVGQ